MKSLKLFAIAVFMITMLARCTSLNYSEQDQFTHDLFFSDMSRAKSILTDAYTYLPDDFNRISGAMRSSASDEAKDVWDISDIQKFNDGSWNPLVTIDDQWSNMYNGIRSCNRFLADAAGLTFDNLKYNLDYPQLMQQYVLYKYEARFLRAFFYFELIKRYGSVPLITTILTSDESNKVSQSSFDAIVSFISVECDSAIAHLPVSYSGLPGAETGRATQGAAMALKARTLLYAASPLHNPTNDQAKWIAAAKAAKAIIDQLGQLGNNTYTPLPTYANAINSITASRELILEKRAAATRNFESANTAVGFIGGNTGTMPSQNLVDSYEMKTTGKAIGEAGSGYDPTNPYATSGAAARDPRFAATILYNTSLWKSIAVQTFYGGLNAPPTPNTTKTGYYIKKYMGTLSLDPVSPGTSRHYWVIFRYAEVLLNYAEAMNEAYGPEVAGPAPLDNYTARAAVNYVRARTGVAMPGFPVGMTQSDFRTKLQRERMVELAFEDHRFWDLRRWKIGPSTTTIRGVDITRVSINPDVYSYTPKVVETRVWDDKMYLYPIPQAELFINHNLVQNPGW